jgi:hypothetical protein
MDPSLALAFALTTVDWGQTLGRRRATEAHPALKAELNPLLGSRPGRGTINTYFLTTYAATTLLHYELPGPWGERYTLVYNGLEGANVARNCYIHVKIRF